MDKEKLSALEPFFDGWSLDKVIEEKENVTLYRVMKVTSDGEVSFRQLNVEDVTAPPPRGDGEYPEEIKIKLLELEIMQKMKNCGKVVGYYDSRAVYNGNGEYAVVSLREDVKAMSEEYDLHDLPVSSALKAVVCACDAVAQFRSMGITHENISLENIFVDSLGEFKLGSFVSAGNRVDCMAPEEYSQNADISQADVYSLGMLLYKALGKNRAPFLPEYPIEVTEENLSNARQRRLGGEVPSAPENAPEGTGKIIKKACALKPGDRYQNLSSIKRDVEAILCRVDPTYQTAQATVTGYAFGQSVPKAQREQEDENGEFIIKDDSPSGYGYDGSSYYDNGKEDTGKIIRGLIVAILAVTVISLVFIGYTLIGGEPETTAPTTTVPTTTQPTTTQPTTTEPTTTEPTTTQPTTTEPTAPTVPTETTTKPEVSTTVVTTTKPTTTAAPKPAYVTVENPKFELIEDNGRVEEILVFADATFGTKVVADADALLYTYDESGTIIKTQAVSVDCYYDIDHPGMTVCDMIIPSDIEIDTESYTYEIYIPKDLIVGTDSKNAAFSVEL